MLILYYNPNCPFCHKVLEEAKTLDIEFDLKDITGNGDLVNELVAKGGKKQVPFMVDSDKEVSIYESDDIIDYIRNL